MYSARIDSVVGKMGAANGPSLRYQGRYLAQLFLVFSLFMAMSATARAQDLSIPLQMGEPEAWLVTYSPGEAYWQRFGHNAIWIRDPTRGIDHVFNSGFFDFNQERFFQRFIQGRMLYFSAAQAAADEFEQYRRDNRSITAQKLDLGILEYETLLNFLMEQVQLENRDYLYDYYLDNCSTRIRDAIDFAVGGAISRGLSRQVAQQNFRAHTRRSVSMDFWYYLALESALGLPVDRSISSWDEMFLPAVVSQELAGFEYQGRALVNAEHVVFASRAVEVPSGPPQLWWRYFAAGLFLAAFFTVLGRMAGPVMSRGSINAWLMIAASGGLLLAYLWWFTNHQAAGPNVNLLLLNPLFLLGLWPALRKFAAILLAGGLFLAGIQGLFPAGQYNLDLWSFMLPVNSVTAWWLWIRGSKPV